MGADMRTGYGYAGVWMWVWRQVCMSKFDRGRDRCGHLIFAKVYVTARADKSEAQCTFMRRARQVVHTLAPEFSLRKLSRLLKAKTTPVPTTV